MRSCGMLLIVWARSWLVPHTPERRQGSGRITVQTSSTLTITGGKLQSGSSAEISSGSDGKSKCYETPVPCTVRRDVDCTVTLTWNKWPCNASWVRNALAPKTRKASVQGAVSSFKIVMH